MNKEIIFSSKEEMDAFFAGQKPSKYVGIVDGETSYVTFHTNPYNGINEVAPNYVPESPMYDKIVDFTMYNVADHYARIIGNHYSPRQYYLAFDVSKTYASFTKSYNTSTGSHTYEFEITTNEEETPVMPNVGIALKENGYVTDYYPSVICLTIDNVKYGLVPYDCTGNKFNWAWEWGPTMFTNTDNPVYVVYNINQDGYGYFGADFWDGYELKDYTEFATDPYLTVENLELCLLPETYLGIYRGNKLLISRDFFFTIDGKKYWYDDFQSIYYYYKADGVWYDCSGNEIEFEDIPAFDGMYAIYTEEEPDEPTTEPTIGHATFPYTLDYLAIEDIDDDTEEPEGNVYIGIPSLDFDQVVDIEVVSDDNTYHVSEVYVEDNKLMMVHDGYLGETGYEHCSLVPFTVTIAGEEYYLVAGYGSSTFFNWDTIVPIFEGHDAYLVYNTNF